MTYNESILRRIFDLTDINVIFREVFLVIAATYVAVLHA